MRRWFVFLWLWGLTVDAWAWRCDGWIIEAGQTHYEVAQKCGDPEAVDRRTEWRVVQNFQQWCENRMEPVPAARPAPVPGGKPGGAPPQAGGRIEYRPRTVCTTVPVDVTVPVEVEEWYYSEEGSGNVPRLLYFENGRLVFIEPLWGQRRLR